MRKITLLMSFLITFAVAFGQLPYDDVYYQPGNSNPPQEKTIKTYYNDSYKTQETYGVSNVSISFGFGMSNYPWYYNSYGWNYYPYHYNWNYYGWNYYGWNYYPYYWHQPYYYNWNYYGGNYYNGHQGYKKHYGPRQSNYGPTTIPRNRTAPKYVKPKSTTPKYDKPRYYKRGTSPKYRYNSPSQNHRSVDYIRIRTNSKENKTPKYNRNRKSPEYWNRFNNMSRPAPRQSPQRYNTQPRQRSQPRQSPQKHNIQPRKR